MCMRGKECRRRNRGICVALEVEQYVDWVVVPILKPANDKRSVKLQIQSTAFIMSLPGASNVCVLLVDDMLYVLAQLLDLIRHQDTRYSAANRQNFQLAILGIPEPCQRHSQSST